MIDPKEIKFMNLTDQGYIIGMTSAKDDVEFIVKRNLDDANPAEIISAKDINPIPLTEEWLERFGWVWNEECNSFEKYPNGDVRMNMVKELHSWTMFNYVIKVVTCKKIWHVHQLQNLYRALTGQELELNHPPEQKS